MLKTKKAQVNRIRILKLSTGSHGVKTIEDPEEINRILKLIEKEAEKFPYFVHSPQRQMFRIELYNDQELLEGIGVSGDFVFRENEWCLMRDSSLNEELVRSTKNVPLTKIGPCTFKQVEG